MAKISDQETKLEFLHALLTRQGAQKILETEAPDMIDLLDIEFQNVPIRVHVEELSHMSDDSYQETLILLRDFLLGE